MVSTMPVNKMRASEPSVTPSPTRRTTSGWKMTAAAAAVSVEIASTMMAGSFFQMRKTVMAGTIMSQGVIWKRAARVPE